MSSGQSWLGPTGYTLTWTLSRLAGRWCNGNTADSGSVYRGSNPCLPANSHHGRWMASSSGSVENKARSRRALRHVMAEAFQVGFRELRLPGA